MTAEAEDRLRGGVLAGLTLLALVGGGWWWRTNVPATGPVRGDPVVVPSPDPLRVAALAGVDPDATVRIHVDENDRIVDVVELPGADGGGPGVGLPRFTDTMWRERVTLSPGGGVHREAPADGARHLLQYRCSGEGELLVVVHQGRLTERRQVECDDILGTVDLTQGDERSRVDLVAGEGGPVEVEAQLVALP